MPNREVIARSSVADRGMLARLGVQNDMVDVFSRTKRSDVMARIRSRGNKATEIAFMTLLRAHRITGWRRHVSIMLPKSEDAQERRGHQVKPDFVFKDRRVAVFIDGCFWHGCPIHGTKPDANREFWRDKLRDNRARDRFVDSALRQQKWTVLRFWEHQLRRGDWVMAKFRLLTASSDNQTR